MNGNLTANDLFLLDCDMKTFEEEADKRYWTQCLLYQLCLETSRYFLNISDPKIERNNLMRDKLYFLTTKSIFQQICWMLSKCELNFEESLKLMFDKIMEYHKLTIYDIIQKIIFLDPEVVLKIIDFLVKYYKIDLHKKYQCGGEIMFCEEFDIMAIAIFYKDVNTIDRLNRIYNIDYFNSLDIIRKAYGFELTEDVFICIKYIEKQRHEVLKKLKVFRK